MTEFKPFDVNKTLTLYLELKGWERDIEGWRLSLGPGRSVSCSSLGMAIDHQLELDVSAPFNGSEQND